VTGTLIEPLARGFYARSAVVVARDLLGAMLVHRLDGAVLAGRIVETEAYVSDIDESSHAYRGQTARNRSMFGPAGHAYVYRSYGIHCCLNVVTTLAGGPASAVLIRALEPEMGLQVIRAHRPGVPDRALLSGPGNLCRGLGIDLTLDGQDLVGDRLFNLSSGTLDRPIVTTTRIGISRSVELPWRFYVLASPAVSRRDRQAEAMLDGPDPTASQGEHDATTG
jgi:DNA-3-methyladenine glycosylase